MLDQLDKFSAKLPRSNLSCLTSFPECFSWNIGPAHIVSFDTEIYYWRNTHDNIKRQYDWLEADLKEANLPENRAARPWIITMGHKPMYCSSVDNGELCTNPKNPVSSRQLAVGEEGRGEERESCMYEREVEGERVCG